MIEHTPLGDPCEKCGQPEYKHRNRRERGPYFQIYEQTPKRKGWKKKYESTAERKAVVKANRQKRGPINQPIIGIDGEGITTSEGEHLYIYLAAVDENGKVRGEAYNEFGLSLQECLDLILALPRDSLVFGYMITYDMTKILESLPAIDRYRLMRMDERRRRTCKDCKHSWNVGRATCPKCKSGRVHELTTLIHHKGYGFNYQQGAYTFCHEK